jgi:4-alpha-glucanotransferase
LLAAFGVRSDDQTSLELANANIDVAHWQRTLLPVVMHQHGNAPIGISVIIGISGLDVPLHWEISSQSNVRYNGQVDSQHFQRGEQRTLDDSVRVEITIALELSTTLPLGYYRLRIWQDGQTSTETTLIVYPARCMDVPESGNSPRHWGLTVQLYSLRSVRNWGIGDYSDLIRLIDTAADLGAALVGVNPLHALNLHLPPVPNPYSPNSRHFLNVTYLDVEAIDDFSESGFTLTPGQQAALTTLRASEFIDHAGVIALKMTVL